MKAHQATHPVRVMCRLLQVSVSGFYAWRDRAVSLRRQTDLALARKIREIHHRSHGTYGAPRIHAELAVLHDIHIGRKRVARLMRAEQLRGTTPKRWVPTTTQAPQAGFAHDLVNRNFRAIAPNHLWVGGHHLHTRRSSQPIPGGRRRRLVTQGGGLVHGPCHAQRAGGRRSQYGPCPTTSAVRDPSLRSWRPSTPRCCSRTDAKDAHVRVSMGSTGDAYDNALCESFFATLKRELLLEHHFSTPTEARNAIFPLHRRLVQPASAPLGTRLCRAHRFRKEH